MVIETGAQVRIAGVRGANGEGIFLGVNENGLAVVELPAWGGVLRLVEGRRSRVTGWHVADPEPAAIPRDLRPSTLACDALQPTI